MMGTLDKLVKQEVSITNVEDLEIINEACAIKNPEGSINERKRGFYLKKCLVPWGLVMYWKTLVENRAKLPIDKKFYWSDLNDSFWPEEDIKRALNFTPHLNAIILLALSQNTAKWM